MRLPGTCIICRQPVIWNGRFWKDPTRGSGRRHLCRCWAWMPQAHERCARLPGHSGDHRTRYALDNAAVAKRKPVAA